MEIDSEKVMQTMAKWWQNVKADDEPVLYDPLHQGPAECSKSMQYLAAVVICLGAVSCGTALGWTSPVLPQLSRNETDPIYLSLDDRTWISSLLPIGALISSVPAGFVADAIGRKYAAIVLDIPFLIGWACLVFAKSPLWFYFGRFVSGLSTASFCVVIPIYVSEIADTTIRGALGTFFQLFLTIGILFVYTVGAFVDWVALSAICSLFNIALFISMFFLPESPTYLLKKGRRAESARSLRWLRGRYCDLREAFQQIQTDLDQSSGGGGPAELFTQKANLKTLGISLSLMFFQQFSGINTVIFFTVSIFTAAGSTLDPSICTIIVGAVQVAMTMFAGIIIERTGRKILLLFSSSVMGICLVLLGVFFHLKDNGHDVSNIGWLPLLSVVLFIVAFSVGYGPVPWLMAGELFLPSVKGTGVSISVLFNWSLAFIVTKSFEIMVNAWGADYTFWFFSIFMLIGTIFVMVYVFETKGKTATEIQMRFEGKSN